MGKRILVADDEPKILKVIAARLKANKYEVMTASNGAEAMEKAVKEKPDLMIVDLIMPEKNGYQVCREVREHPEIRETPIIVLSAWVRDKAGENTAVADVYVTKPFDAKMLLREVEHLLEHGRPKAKENVT